MKKKKYDLLVIGLGPAGMAVTAMGVAMGLDVLVFEKNKLGGECLNVGCIPSKALLKAAASLHSAKNLAKFGIEAELNILQNNSMQVVRDKVAQISGKKIQKTFEKATIIKANASFVSPKEVQADGKTYTAKKIFIATGTTPMIPPIPGLADVPKLTNENVFDLDKYPQSLTILGGGAIGCELAQAFARMGSKVSIVHKDEHLLPLGDREAAELLEAKFISEGITVFNGVNITKVEQVAGKVVTHLEQGQVVSEQIMVAAGRKPSLEKLNLNNAKIKYDRCGITVNQHLRTNKSGIYAVGDCNGLNLFSHAAMHQGMLALMDAVSPFRLSFLQRKKYLVPWSVFTEPEVAQVGLDERQARERGLKFEVVRKEFADYGRLVADGAPSGFIKVLVSKSGKIYGVTVVGESASELIHEWIPIMQYGKKMHHILLMQHSFPTVSMISKMVAEQWMMGKMSGKFVRGLAKWLV